MDKLRDIKDIVEVQDYSLYLLIALLVVAILLVLIFIYLYKNRRVRRKRPTQKQIALSKLQNIDYTNTKQVVYTFSENFVYFIDETNQVEFENIEKVLVDYKYKKVVSKLPKELENRIKELIRSAK